MKTKRGFIAASALLLLSQLPITAWAQQLKGVVIDKNSKETLIGAVISVEGSDVKAVTDIDGNFTLDGLKNGKNGFESDNCADGAQVTPYTTATFSNITFVGPKTASDFQNTSDYINAGNYFPNNGSGLGKFQAAMQIRRSSRLNCVNSLITDWPIGLIIDGEKGDTPAQATANGFKLQNIYMANADIIGSDANKCYEDKEYDFYAKAVKADSKQSFSHTFFEKFESNKYFADKTSLLLTDGKQVGVPFMPQAGSPLFGAQSFAGLDSWFTTVSYIGAFDANDTWMDGWTNFDPQNTQY